MATLTLAAPQDPPPAAPPAEGSRAVRDSLIVVLGGQLERALGTLTALAMKWGLDPARHGVYSGLRLFLDNTNRTSLGIGVGAVQEIPVLRAAGDEEGARRIADVAYTTNTITCLVYSLALLAVAAWRAPGLAGEPLAAEWTWGLAIVAGLAVLKRYQDFLIALHRAEQRFGLTTELAVLDSLVSAVLVPLGLWLAGLWGLWAAVAGLMAFNVVYLHARHPLRCRFAWDGPTAGRLCRVGLPILANSAIFGAVLSADRVVILAMLPEGERALGLYSIAIMGTSWALDLAGRIVLVMYTYFQTTLGRTKDPVEVARQAARVTEAQSPLLAAGSAVAYLVGPVFLGLLIPRYADGLVALRPLLPGMLALGLAWPARQMLITINRPYLLFVGTAVGLAATVGAGAMGASLAGIEGVAWGMSAGYLVVYLISSASAYCPGLGIPGWVAHQGRLLAVIGYYAAGALLSAHTPLPGALGRWPSFVIRCVFLASWGLPALWLWARRYGWGGLLEGKVGSWLGRGGGAAR
jgi:O-antigen/teichoic acid export membrane protein